MIQPIGYFRLWRELYSKPIWLKSSLEQKTILIALLGMANFKPKQWEWQGKKFEVKEGQFITSANSIIECCGGGITRQNVRTALERFRKLDFLTYESTKTGLLITIDNWVLYQGNIEQPNQPSNHDLTMSQPSPNHDLTTREEGNKEKNDKNDKKEDIYIPYSEIIDYLNLKSNSKYKHTTSKNRELIKARWNEKNTLDNFKTVIDKKCNEWLGTEQAKYLRPETLFGNKFEGYLNQKEDNNGGNRRDNSKATDKPKYDFSKYGG